MELLHRRCCGLDVRKETVAACLRLVSDGKVTTEVRTFQTATADLLRLSEWLAVNGCTHVAMEATGVYWKLVWHIPDDGEFELVLANAAHVKNVPGRKTDVNDAMWLAELLAHGLIRASFAPEALTGGFSGAPGRGAIFATAAGLWPTRLRTCLHLQAARATLSQSQA
jgi:transposase